MNNAETFLEEFDTLQNIGGAYNFLSFDTSHLHHLLEQRP